jgi:cytochrome c oxidase assembly protein subunit 15
MRWLGLVAVFAVVLQGVLGGLRVTQLKDELGIFHAALAQLFFGLVSAIALFSSRWWREAAKRPVSNRSGLVNLFWLGTGLVFFQLVLGATMRHQHAGLAISDFPLAHQQIWPAMDPASIARYNQERLEIIAANPITAFQVALQMVHRLTALLILAAIGWALRATKRRLGWKAPLTKLALAWSCLIAAQAVLGAATIWSDKAADIATAHVAVGALSLMTGAMLVLMAQRSLEQVPVTSRAHAPISGEFQHEQQSPA